MHRLARVDWRSHMTETVSPAPTLPAHAFVHRILRYAPNALRDEWFNIGVLVFDPKTGERRMRLIEEEDEYRRIRRLLPSADEAVLRGLPGELQNRLDAAAAEGNGSPGEWQKILAKWDLTLADAVQLAQPIGTYGTDL